MLHTLAIPARVVGNGRRIFVRVAPLEAAEFDEPGTRGGAAQPGDLRDTHALPGRDGGPAFAHGTASRRASSFSTPAAGTSPCRAPGGSGRRGSTAAR